MSALICGSFAYDNIMVFKGRFKNHILPEQVHVLSVSFLVPEMRQNFGGCAGNIAYNLNLLEENPTPMATVGKDFGRYAEWMDEKGINRRHITSIDDAFTAQAFITTDLDDNQITAFHPGAMEFSNINSVRDADDIDIGIIAPDSRQAMMEHAAQFDEAGIPFIFDPSQQLPMFDADDLNHFFNQADFVTVNDYEWKMIHERTTLSPKDLLNKIKALIVTRGAEGATIFTPDTEFTIPAVRVDEVVDPTGCGDAHRAGLLYGLNHGLDWETTGRLGALMGAIKVGHHGTQVHSFEMDEFRQRFKDEFGYAF